MRSGFALLAVDRSEYDRHWCPETETRFSCLVAIGKSTWVSDVVGKDHYNFLVSEIRSPGALCTTKRRVVLDPGKLLCRLGSAKAQGDRAQRLQVREYSHAGNRGWAKDIAKDRPDCRPNRSTGGTIATSPGRSRGSSDMVHEPQTDLSLFETH